MRIESEEKVIEFKVVTKPPYTGQPDFDKLNNTSEDGTINSTIKELFNTEAKILEVTSYDNLQNKYLVYDNPAFSPPSNNVHPLIFRIIRAAIEHGLTVNKTTLEKFHLDTLYYYTSHTQCTLLSFILSCNCYNVEQINTRNLILMQLLKNGVGLDNPDHKINNEGNHIIFAAMDLSDWGTHQACPNYYTKDPLFDVAPLRLLMQHIKTNITDIVGKFSDIEEPVTPLQYIKYLYTNPTHKNSDLDQNCNAFPKSCTYRQTIMSILSGPETVERSH